MNSQTVPLSIENLPQQHMALLHRLASRAVATAVQEGRELSWSQLRKLAGEIPDILTPKSGAFVTLKISGELRGCIGYIMPVKPLYQAIMENGVNAAIRDTRFSPVGLAELAHLDLEISVLSPPVSIPSYDIFLVGQEGIILHKNGRSAVFLPEVATEQGWTQQQTLEHLALKAGLPRDAWRHGATFQVFRSQKYAAPIELL